MVPHSSLRLRDVATPAAIAMQCGYRPGADENAPSLKPILRQSQSQPTLKTTPPQQERLTPPLPSMTLVAPRLFIGNLPSIGDRSLLEKNNIKGIVSLGTGRWGFWNMIAEVTRDYVPQEKHIFVVTLDNGSQDILVYMETLCNFMDNVFASMSKDHPTGAVLVHCDRGVSRSAAIAIAYLMRKHGHGFDDTFAVVRSQRKINPNANFREQLRIWEQLRYAVWENREAGIPKAAYQVFLNARAAEMEAKGLVVDTPVAYSK
jgi:Dual specificity phosphatase, catalytic domain